MTGFGLPRSAAAMACVLMAFALASLPARAQVEVKRIKVPENTELKGTLDQASVTGKVGEDEDARECRAIGKRISEARDAVNAARLEADFYDKLEIAAIALRETAAELDALKDGADPKKVGKILSGIAKLLDSELSPNIKALLEAPKKIKDGIGTTADTLNLIALALETINPKKRSSDPIRLFKDFMSAYDLLRKVGKKSPIAPVLEGYGTMLENAEKGLVKIAGAAQRRNDIINITKPGGPLPAQPLSDPLWEKVQQLEGKLLAREEEAREHGCRTDGRLLGRITEDELAQCYRDAGLTEKQRNDYVGQKARGLKLKWQTPGLRKKARTEKAWAENYKRKLKNKTDYIQDLQQGYSTKRQQAQKVLDSGAEPALRGVRIPKKPGNALLYCVRVSRLPVSGVWRILEAPCKNREALDATRDELARLRVLSKAAERQKPLQIKYAAHAKELATLKERIEEGRARHLKFETCLKRALEN